MINVADLIRKEIAMHGAIPFARFMELALYCPLCGYYEKKRDTPGRGGDFYTSVNVGPLFGELLAFQFAEWLQVSKTTDSRLQIVEAGAHDGQLAQDILAWLRVRRPALFDHIEYWILEPSKHRQEWQQETLNAFPPRVRWFANLGALTESFSNPFTASQSKGDSPSSLVAGGAGGAEANLSDETEVSSHPDRTGERFVNGIIFSNELLDAMPVHRLGWDAKRREWFEWGVTLAGEKYVWTRMTDGNSASVDHSLRPGSSTASDRTKTEAISTAVRVVITGVGLKPGVDKNKLFSTLPDGFTVEICPAAERWWNEAASLLKRGKLLTLDYGLTAEELFLPHRVNGTLRAYRRHHFADDVLAVPGEQDLSAHVNFTAIRRVGEVAGLQTKAFATQAQFLTSIAQRAWREGSEFGLWTRAYTRQFQTLTHPDHFGRSYRVLIQSTKSDG
jgi:SAM-dependent MidA family methyltransferase